VFVKILKKIKSLQFLKKNQKIQRKSKKIKKIKKIKNRDFLYWDGKEHHGGRFLVRLMKSVFSISGVPKSGFCSCGPKLGVTNSKNIEKMRDFRVASFYVT
jgi:hypothetical protein